MAYLLTHFWPGGTEERYRASLEAAHPGGELPQGQFHHAAGPCEGGFLVSALWESKEDCDRFLQEVLLAGPIEDGLQGPPEGRTAEVVNLRSREPSHR